MSNARFAISLHTLALLARFPDEVMTSDRVAGSINVNPVLVRKEISNLRKKGLIESKEGKNGGNYLAKQANKILLSDVYKAVHEAPLLSKNKNKPNPDCVIGRSINKRLDEVYEDVEAGIRQKLGKLTLAEFVSRFK